MTTVKTTVYLDGADYRRLKALAAAEGRSAAELIRVAVAEYTRRHAARRRHGRRTTAAKTCLRGSGVGPSAN